MRSFTTCSGGDCKMRSFTTCTGGDCKMRSFTTCTTQKNYIFVIRTRTVRLIWHVARVEEMRDAYGVLSWKSERKGQLENYV